MSTSHFLTFMRDRQAEILDAWQLAVRELPSAHKVSQPVLIDHLPQVLQSVGRLADRLIGAAHAGPPAEEAAEVHGVSRLAAGFDLAAVVSEFTILRRCILDVWEKEHPNSAIVSMRALNRAIDAVVAASVERYTRAEAQTLQALDQLAKAAFESPSLQTFADQMLATLTRVIPAADTAALLLREGDALQVRAAIGLEDEVASNFTVRIGDGFAGMIAQRRQPMELAAGEIASATRSETLRRSGLRALYGVPLIQRDEVVGVLHVGSTSKERFSDQDKRMLDAMATRAAVAICQHALRETADLRARQQAAIAELGEVGLRSDTPQQVMQRACELITSVLHTKFAAILEHCGDSLVPRAVFGWAATVIGQPQPISTIPHAMYTLSVDEPVIVTDFSTETRFRVSGLLVEHDIRSGIAVVVRPRGDPASPPYGVLTTHCRRPRPFNREDADFLQAVGNIIASAVSHWRDAEAMRVRESRLRLANEAAALGTYDLDIASGKLHWSPRMYAILGVPEGTPMTLDLYMRHVHADDLAGVRDALAAAVRPGSDGKYSAEYRILRADENSERWVASYGQVFYDEYGQPQRLLGTLHDTTERRAAEQQLRASKELLERVIAQTGEGIIVADQHGRIVEFNAAAERQHGVAKRSVAAPEWAQAYGLLTLDERPLPLADTPMYRAMDGEVIPKAYWKVRRPDGSIRTLAGSAAPLRGPRGEPEGAVLVTRDETERIRSEAERERLLHKLEDAVRLREDLLAVVSHDLRSPLAAINLAASLLARRGTSLSESRVRQQLEIILRAGRRMETLIESLLDMASIEAGRLSVELAPCAVREMIDEAVEFHAPLAKAKTIALRTGRVGDAEVCCDSDRIQQVFANVLGNAIKFCSDGDTITVSAEPLADAVRIAVADTGPGIPPEVQARIFEPYWSAREYERKGTGLGLFISQGIVRAHGGELWVESSLGDGSTFYFTLPYPADSSPPEEPGT